MAMERKKLMKLMNSKSMIKTAEKMRLIEVNNLCYRCGFSIGVDAGKLRCFSADPFVVVIR